MHFFKYKTNNLISLINQIQYKQIIFKKCTKSGLDKKIKNKRTSVFSKVQLQTESESDSINMNKSKSCLQSIHIKEQNLKKYHSLILTKLDNKNKLEGHDSDDKTAIVEQIDYINHNPESTGAEKHENYDTVAVLNDNQKSIKAKKDESSGKDKKATASVLIDNCKNTRKPKEDSKEDRCSTQKDKIATVRADEVESVNKENIDSNNIPKVTKIFTEKEFKQKVQELDKKCNEVIHLESKLKSAKAKNKELLESNTTMHGNIKKLKKELTEYQSLNKDLQKHVVEKSKEYEGLTNFKYRGGRFRINTNNVNNCSNTSGRPVFSHRHGSKKKFCPYWKITQFRQNVSHRSRYMYNGKCL